jgi:hypothetical protein
MIDIGRRVSVVFMTLRFVEDIFGLMAIRGRALCNRNLRTPPDPEGSNGKEALLCAAGSPGPGFPKNVNVTVGRNRKLFLFNDSRYTLKV